MIVILNFIRYGDRAEPHIFAHVFVIYCKQWWVDKVTQFWLHCFLEFIVYNMVPRYIQRKIFPPEFHLEVSGLHKPTENIMQQLSFWHVLFFNTFIQFVLSTHLCKNIPKQDVRMMTPPLLRFAVNSITISKWPITYGSCSQIGITWKVV